MGLSSSQARLLTLTSRQHAVEYSAQRLEAQKLQLANDSDQVYNEYLKRLDATKVQYRVVNNDGSMYFDDATFTKLANKHFLFNVNGTICNDLAGVKTALQAQGIEITADDSYTLLTSLVSEGLVVIMEVSDDAEAGYEYKNGQIWYTDPATGEYVDPVSNNPTSSGYSVTDASKSEYVFKVFKNTSLSTSTNIQEISDEKELKKAEAQYEADMNRINAKDARYDTELSQLETERNAIKNEIDTLKTVAKDNVDRTFKLFS